MANHDPEIRITNCPGHYEYDSESSSWNFIGHIEFHQGQWMYGLGHSWPDPEVEIYTYHVSDAESTTIDRKGPVYERIAHLDGRCVTKVHHFGVDFKQEEQYFDAIAVYLMLTAPDDFSFELVLPDLNDLELLTVFHQEELPELIFPNLYPEICKGGVEKPLQWGPKYAELLIETVGKLAWWLKVPRGEVPKAKTDSELYRWIVTRPQVDPSRGDAWNIALSELNFTVEKITRDYRAGKFDAIKATGLVTLELWNSCIKYMERKAGYDKESLSLVTTFDGDVAEVPGDTIPEQELTLALPPVEFSIAKNLVKDPLLKGTELHRKLQQQGHDISYKKTLRTKKEVEEIYEQAMGEAYRFTLFFAVEVEEGRKKQRPDEPAIEIEISTEELPEETKKEIRQLVENATQNAEDEKN